MSEEQIRSTPESEEIRRLESISEVRRVSALVAETQPAWAAHLRNVCDEAEQIHELRDAELSSAYESVGLLMKALGHGGGHGSMTIEVIERMQKAEAAVALSERKPSMAEVIAAGGVITGITIRAPAPTDKVSDGAGRPATLAEALSILKGVHKLSPAEMRDIDEAIGCIVAFDGITEEMVEWALDAADGVMIDTRRPWHPSDRASTRDMLEAVIDGMKPMRSRSVAPSAGESISGHEGGKVTRERIVQGHSFFPSSAAFPQGYATGHRPYSQGHLDANGKQTEACYICTCLAEIDRLERALGTHSAREEICRNPQGSHGRWSATERHCYSCGVTVKHGEELICQYPPDRKAP